jgi:hypothetical protein
MIQQAVFHTLAYADIFDYPLTVDEIHRYLTSMKGSREEISRVLADDALFTRVEQYFVLRGREEIVKTRKQRAEISARLWRKAGRYGRMIAGLPFVRMVAVTGSLAMNNTDEDKDVDYLIVTAPNRLWTCRALSLLVARIAKLEGVKLCPNYLITTNALDLKERSLYVAHELAQMIPLSGADTYLELHRQNDWIADYLPNVLMVPEIKQVVKRDPSRTHFVIQRILEILFALPFANWFEKWEMNRKIARLTREQSSSAESYFSADVCKGHIDKHGQKTEDIFLKRLRTLPHPGTLPQGERTGVRVWGAGN